MQVNLSCYVFNAVKHVYIFNSDLLRIKIILIKLLNHIYEYTIIFLIQTITALVQAVVSIQQRHTVSTHNRSLSHKAGLGVTIYCFLHNDLGTALFSKMSSISGDFFWLRVYKRQNIFFVLFQAQLHIWCFIGSCLHRVAVQLFLRP